MSAPTPAEQAEANTAQILAQQRVIIGLLERLLETLTDQPDYLAHREAVTT